jgi:hypothetical protein
MSFSSVPPDQEVEIVVDSSEHGVDGIAECELIASDAVPAFERPNYMLAA